MSISIRELTDSDRDWVESVFREYWGGEFIVSRGKAYHAKDVKGVCAVNTKGERVGLATYYIKRHECEMVSLNAFTKVAGIGTMLVDAVKRTARVAGCSRLWLTTTNDNLDAIRFYQRRGFQLVAVHPNAMEVSRKLKPSIPEVGNFGIPLRDELEFEIRL